MWETGSGPAHRNVVAEPQANGTSIDLGIDHGFEAGDLLPGSDFCCSSFFRGFCAGLGAAQRRGEGVAVVALGACALGFVCCPLECACCKGKRFNNHTEKANRARA